MSGYENWQATILQKQLFQKTLNVDSEERHVSPNHNKRYCISESEKRPIREDRNRNQSDCVGVTVKHKMDAQKEIKKRVIAKASEKELEVEDNMTKDLARLLQGETSNQQPDRGQLLYPSH